jgi:hypothetical protein
MFGYLAPIYHSVVVHSLYSFPMPRDPAIFTNLGHSASTKSYSTSKRRIMAPRPPPGALSSFITSPTLMPFHIQVKNYLSSHLSKQRILAAVLVFSPSNSTHVLIVQRSATDYVPNLWEIPGGSCDPDKSILAGAVRELWEESDLLDCSPSTSHTAYVHGSKGTISQ